MGYAGSKQHRICFEWSARLGEASMATSGHRKSERTALGSFYLGWEVIYEGRGGIRVHMRRVNYSCAVSVSIGLTLLLLLINVLHGRSTSASRGKEEDFYPQGVIKRVLQKARREFRELGISDMSCENPSDFTNEEAHGSNGRTGDFHDSRYRSVFGPENYILGEDDYDEDGDVTSEDDYLEGDEDFLNHEENMQDYDDYIEDYEDFIEDYEDDEDYIEEYEDYLEGDDDEYEFDDDG